MAHLAENRYGKARVRVMKVVRHATHHEMKEWSVRVLLDGDFETSYTKADNSKVLPTDTMKNTIYYVARASKATTPEEYAMELGEYLLANHVQVSAVSVEVEEKSWGRVPVEGKPHPTTYSLQGPEVQTAMATKTRGGEFEIISGVDGMVILKTTDSEFTGYAVDKLTTLKPATDRIFATRATIAWGYCKTPKDYAATRAAVLESVMTTFAQHHSLSVQHTIYDIGEAVIQSVPEIEWVKQTMPNLHCLPVNLEPFGQDNPNMIFVPTDEPHGYIEAMVRR